MCRDEIPTLDTVIPEKTEPVGEAMMGSSHVDELGTTVASATASEPATKEVSEIINQCWV